MPTDSLPVYSEEAGGDPLRTLHVIGVSYRELSIDKREKFAVSSTRRDELLRVLAGLPHVAEAAIVSTCNRVEMVVAGDPDSAKQDLVCGEVSRLFSEMCSMKSIEVSSLLYRYRGLDAVRHVFEVAAGLDSMIFGEPQILGQLKGAYRAAHVQGMTGAVLNRLFHRAFSAAKTVRTKTSIGRNAVSVCFAIRELASQIFGDLGKTSVMLLGTGEIGMLSLKHFKAAGTNTFFVVSGDMRRAVPFAERFGAVPLTLANYSAYISQADVIIGARALEVGDEPYLSFDIAKRAVKERNGQPQFYVDLGVPRNFASAIEGLQDAFLYTIDDMEGVVQQNLEARRAAKGDADNIIAGEVKKFAQWLERRQADPVIKALRERAAVIEEAEVERSLNRLRNKGCDSWTLALVESEIRGLSHRLSAKLLHRPCSGIKEEVRRDTKVVDKLKRLFLGDC